jgi:GPH family glycoside/pentoside/hexuronide:cation symporter
MFYTKVLGIASSLVGILFLASRILDAFTDIGMGILVDKSKPGKDGKFIPWIRRMAGPFAISTFLMYQSSLASAPMNIRVIYMFVTYILWGSIFYTATNIPYGSMASVITEDPAERTALSTFRNLGATFAGLIIGVVAPQIVYNADSSINPTNFTMVAGVFSLLSFICYFACTKMCTERVKFTLEEKEIINDFIKVFNEDKMLAIKMLFFTGDIREGMGERRVFNVCMNWIANNHPDIAIAVLPLIAEYNRWDSAINLCLN